MFVLTRLLHAHCYGCVIPGAQLSAAIAGWQARQSLERVLSTGFLDGTHPIVDAYELVVRLDHMLRRLAALQGAANAQVGPQLICSVCFWC